MIPLEGVMHLFEMIVPFNICISFQMVEHSIEVGHVYLYVKHINPVAHAMPFYTCSCLMKNTWSLQACKICDMSFKIVHYVSKHIIYHNMIFFQDKEPYFENNPL